MTFTYLALVFPVAGTIALLFAQRSLLGDERELFKHVLERFSYEVQERVEAVLLRREVVERFDRRFLWLAIVLLWLGGALGVLRVISVPMTFAICELAFSVVVAAQIAFVSRVRIGKSVALLERRSLTWKNLLFLAIVIAAWVAAAVLCVRFGSIGAYAVSLVGAMVALTFGVRMIYEPSVIGIVDPQVEALVDRKIRNARLARMFVIAGLAPLIVAYAGSLPRSDIDPLVGALNIIAWVGFIVRANVVVRLSKSDIDSVVFALQGGDRALVS